MAALHKNTSTLKLNTGAHIPVIGLGTWQSSENEGYNATLEALKAGYRHIDTAAIYKNEEEIGRAIRDSNSPEMSCLSPPNCGVRNIATQLRP